MEALVIFTPLFTAGIFLFAFLGFQFGIMYFLLNALITPIKKDIFKLETRMDRLETRMDKLETRIAKLEDGQARIEALLKKSLGV